MTPTSASTASTDAEAGSVFLNIPYDRSFARLYLAYIAAIPFFGLVPRATLELPSSRRRLDRIVELIRSCDYSLHDLCRVQLDRNSPATPRFNMPFELGIAVAMDVLQPTHRWIVLEARPHRLAKSLSDLSGTDPFIHQADPAVLMGQLCNIFLHAKTRPHVPDMLDAYQKLRRLVPEVMRRVGTQTLYEARAFHELAVAARTLARLAEPRGPAS